MSKDQNNPEIVDFGDELNVRNVAQAYHHLRDILRQNDAIALDVAKLEDCDLTAAQMIECARRSASRDGKTITLATPPSAALLNVLQRAALVGADADPADTFWLQASGVNG